MKEPNQGEHQLLKTLLKTVHEKCVKAKEAHKHAMDLYLKESLTKTPTPSLGSNDIALMKQEIESLREQKRDLSEKSSQRF